MISSTDLNRVSDYVSSDNLSRILEGNYILYCINSFNLIPKHNLGNKTRKFLRCKKIGVTVENQNGILIFINYDSDNNRK